MTVFAINDNVLELRGLTSQVAGVLSAATVVVTIKDAAGVVQVGAGWPAFPLAMPAVGVDFPGDYRVVFDDAVPWVVGKTYKAIIDANSGDGTWEYTFRPKTRVLPV